MSRVYEVQHPLIQHHLTRLRDESTRPAEFRLLIQRLAVLLAYEATNDLLVTQAAVQTPLTQSHGHQLTQRIGLVPILRAGLGMVDPILHLIPSAEVWHLGALSRRGNRPAGGILQQAAGIGSGGRGAGG